MRLLLILLFSLTTVPGITQSLKRNLTNLTNSNDRFVFYLHGGVVTVLGDNAINQAVPEWGPYEYSNIIDSLRKRNFHVISEIRKEGIDDQFYVNKISKQVDTLLRAGIADKNILVIGASAGAVIALHLSSRLKNNNIHYAILGACWPDTYKDYAGIDFYGHFLSVIETSDPHGTCIGVFNGRKTLRTYDEIKLNTGLSHGFIYKGYKEWIDPVTTWFDKNKS